MLCPFLEQHYLQLTREYDAFSFADHPHTHFESKFKIKTQKAADG